MRKLAAALLIGLLAAAGLGAEPASVEASTVVVDEVADRVVGSRNSNVYHRPGCGHARRILARNLVSWSSEAEARGAGYRPCRVCNPE